MSPRFPFHGFCLINDHVKQRRLVGLGLHHCVWVLSPSSFPHVMAVVRVIYGCQEVPTSSLRPPKPRPTQRAGGGHSHKMLSCICCVKGLREGPFLNPAPWEIKELQRLMVHCPPGQNPELISFISSSCWQGGGCCSSFSSGILAPITDSLRDIWLCPPHCPSLCSFPSLSPQPCSLLCPLLLPPWASELGSLPFGFPLFLPSSVAPLIAPLFLTSRGCQLSGHSWRIQSWHGNCKQSEGARRAERGRTQGSSFK